MSAVTALSLATSCMTIVAMQLLARKRIEGWFVGLANQALWLALIVATGAWGLLVLTVTLTVTYAHAIHRWRSESPITVGGQQ